MAIYALTRTIPYQSFIAEMYSTENQGSMGGMPLIAETKVALYPGCVLLVAEYQKKAKYPSFHSACVTFPLTPHHRTLHPLQILLQVSLRQVEPQLPRERLIKQSSAVDTGDVFVCKLVSLI